MFQGTGVRICLRMCERLQSVLHVTHFIIHSVLWEYLVGMLELCGMLAALRFLKSLLFSWILHRPPWRTVSLQNVRGNFGRFTLNLQTSSFFFSSRSQTPQICWKVRYLCYSVQWVKCSAPTCRPRSKILFLWTENALKGYLKKSYFCGLWKCFKKDT
jgi:hypothetical protein